MMVDPQIIRFIRDEIAKQMQILVWGQSQGNQDDQSEDIGNVFGNSNTITKRVLVEPYGLHAKAPVNTIQCVARSGEHPGAKNVIGHLDQNRPTVSQGESILYNQYGQQIYMKNGQVSVRHNGGKITLGSDVSAQPLVLGTVFQTMMETVLNAIAAHVHVDIMGYETTPPTNASTFSEQEASPVADGAILSDHSFTEK